MKIDNVKTNGKYEIICRLRKGWFKYTLYENSKPIMNMITWKTPESLTHSGEIRKMIELIKIKELGKLQYMQNEIFFHIKNNLEVSLKENEFIFDKYRQTENMIYNQHNNVVCNFAICDVKLVDTVDEIYEITVKENIRTYKMKGSFDEIFDKLKNDDKINPLVGNSKFILKTIFNILCR